MQDAALSALCQPLPPVLGHLRSLNPLVLCPALQGAGLGSTGVLPYLQLINGSHMAESQRAEPRDSHRISIWSCGLQDAVRLKVLNGLIRILN